MKKNNSTSLNFQDFLREHWLELRGNYYSRYDIREKGFAFSDTSPYKLKEIRKSHRLYLKDYDRWREDYCW